MHCYVCDKELTDKETVWNADLEGFEMCTHCLDISLDAAYSNGYGRPDEDDSFVLLDDDDNDNQYSMLDFLTKGSIRDDE